MNTKSRPAMDRAMHLRPRGLINSFWALSFTLLMALLGVSPLLDDLLTDQAFLLQPKTVLGEAPILLIQPRPGFHHEVLWGDLLDRLLADSPKLVAFSFLPRADTAFYRKAVDSGKVVFARALSASNGRAGLEALPLGARDRDLTWGVASLDENPGLLQKVARTRFHFQERPLPSFAAKVSETLTGKETKPTSQRIDFSPLSLPNASYAHVMQGKLPDHLIRDRIIVVAPNPLPVLRALDRVRIPGGRSVSSAAYHALVIRTLMEDRAIGELSIAARAGLVSLIVLFLGILSQFLYIHHLSRTLIGVHLLVLGLAWIGPALLAFHVPASDLLVAIFALSCLTLFDRYRSLIDDVRKYRLDFADLVRRHVPDNRLHQVQTHKTHPLCRHVDARVFAQLRQEAAQLERLLPPHEPVPTYSRDPGQPQPAHLRGG